MIRYVIKVEPLASADTDVSWSRGSHRWCRGHLTGPEVTPGTRRGALSAETGVPHSGHPARPLEAPAYARRIQAPVSPGVSG
ncbi:hypothetical protein SGLAM104S_03263 [Streptomyces glaucescens]